ncbi:di-trans,poly-cis-decaprenylcistransferase [Nocardiopsis dassonvillei]|uniref:polyprenyl diphosphate synthase n=1 Tax=Nocardiopsis dassonvillei TaxID=2014 RepID=UPI0008FCA3E8|nr:polyprenyl diphosphate synthase [Nocardiopsis dassonvillei]APC35035.1 di-trans,poly-cis-decaprenylcistransferase [Nocardiopsis dassonvillei]
MSGYTRTGPPLIAERGADTGLARAFEVCRRIHTGADHVSPRVVDLLPAHKRPYAHALAAFGIWADRLADEGEVSERGPALARFRAEILTALADGPGAPVRLPPVQRAVVHTVRAWDMPVPVLEELLTTLEQDSRRPPDFPGFADLRRYLRGMSGTAAELFGTVLEPVREDTPELMSLLGEVFQYIDILNDLPEDLEQGRCYLPRQDLERFGLDADSLIGALGTDACRELIALQVRRARGLLDRGQEVVDAAHPSSRPFLASMLVGLRTGLDECEYLPAVRPDAPPRTAVPARLSQTRRTPVEVLPVASGTRQRRSPASSSEPGGPPAAVPEHVAVIMDGNRRWAGALGLAAVEGHMAGEEAMYRLVDAAGDLGIKYVTTFAFSTENWSRSPEEVSSLFKVFARRVTGVTGRLHARGVRMRWYGRRTRIEAALRERLEWAEELTSGNSGVTFTFCLDYGGRQEMVDAVKHAAAEAFSGRLDPTRMAESDLAGYLYDPTLPDVDLLIRTAGEQRTSNFLPWHTAYAEIVFDDALWPDFDRSHLVRAVNAYAERRRSFGGTLNEKSA